MAGDNDQEKTEKATPRKRQKAREEGQIAQSREIPSVLILLFSLLFFTFAGSWMLQHLSVLMRGLLQYAGTRELGPDNVASFLWSLFKDTMVLLLPFMVTVLLAGIVGNISQNGFYWSTKPLTPNFSKLDPLKGFKKLVSLRSWVELAKSVFKLVIIGSVAYVMVRREADAMPALVHLQVSQILSYAAKVAFKIILYTTLVLVILAVLDYIYQRWQHEKELRMTKQEVKDEFKNTEGDPKIKARIRSVQRDMARRRMMEAVPEATVVITNPTHLAIALKFENDFKAPMVVAKGAGHLAEKIKAIAQAHKVPIVEQKPLARTLFKSVEIGDFIPVELYRAVAEVLAYVYRLNGRLNAR